MRNCNTTFSRAVLAVGVWLLIGATTPAIAVPTLPAGSSLSWVQARNFYNEPNGSFQVFNNIRVGPASGLNNSVIGSLAVPTLNQSSHADLTVGEVKAFNSITYDPSSGGFLQGAATVNAFDVVTFDLAGASSETISYSFSLDGALSNADPTDAYAHAFGGFYLFDLTDQPVAYHFDITDPSDPILSFANTTGSTATAPLIETASVQSFVGTTDNALLPFIDPAEVIYDSTGTLFPFDVTRTGTFTVLADRVDGIQLFAQAAMEGHGPAVSDLSSTGAFRFTDLGGTTFTSASGALLSNVPTDPTTVPEPATILLLGSSLVGLAGYRYRSTHQ